ASRTHAERKHTSCAPLHGGLMHQAVTRRRQPRPPVCFAVILYPVDKRLRVLHPKSQSKRLGFNGNTLSLQEIENIARRMTRGKNDCLTVDAFTGREDNACNGVAMSQEVGYPGVEVNFSAVLQDRFADRRNEFG